MFGEFLIFKSGKLSRYLGSLCTESSQCWQKNKEIKPGYVVIGSWPEDSLVRQRGCAQLKLYFTLFQSSLWFCCIRHSAGNMSSLSVPPPKRLQKPLAVPYRHMFGPGPSNVPSRILLAGANPVIGHMHPEIFEVTWWLKYRWCSLCPRTDWHKWKTVIIYTWHCKNQTFLHLSVTKRSGFNISMVHRKRQQGTSMLHSGPHPVSCNWITSLWNCSQAMHAILINVFFF